MLIIKMTVATYNYWEPLANEGETLKSECISKHFINC